MPINTDSLRNLISSKLEITDMNNVQSTLNSVLTNPYTGTLEATDGKTSPVPSMNDVVANMITNPFAGSLEAGSLVKTGATHPQYFLGDGSVLQQSAVSGNNNFYFYDSNNTTSDPADSGQVCNCTTHKLASMVYLVSISHLTRDNIEFL